MSKRSRRPAPRATVGAAAFSLEEIETARGILEHMLSMLERLGETPTDTSQWVRELVVAALFRRSIVMAQSIGYLAIQGQIEGCIVMTRTLLEIGVSLRLVLADKSNRLAKRLVANDYRARQQYHAKALADPDTRANIESQPGEKARFASLVRSWRDQLQLPFFNEVRDEIERDLTAGVQWHGFKSISDAIGAVGDTHEYFRQYKVQSAFVHGGNIEWDWLEVLPDADKPGGLKPMLRPMVETSTDQMRLHLAMSLFRLYEAARVIIDDRLNMPAIPDVRLNERRKEIVRAMKMELIEMRAALWGVFGPDPFELDAPAATDGDATPG